MAANDTEEPNGNRATLALVSAQITGLHDLFRAEIGNLQRQMDLVSGVASVVATLATRVAVLEATMLAFERDREADASSAVSSRQFWLGVTALAVTIIIAFKSGRVG